jgi:hypothetical protein
MGMGHFGFFRAAVEEAGPALGGLQLQAGQGWERGGLAGVCERREALDERD